MSDKVAVAYEIVDHGVEHSQYFQGCGTSFTNFTDVSTGIGDTAQDALEDALEMLAQSGWNVDIITEKLDSDDSLEDVREEERIERMEEFLEANPNATEDEFDDDDGDHDERYYHVSIRVRQYNPEHDDPEMLLAGAAIGRLDDLGTTLHNMIVTEERTENISEKVKLGVKIKRLRDERDYLERFLNGIDVKISEESYLKR